MPRIYDISVPVLDGGLVYPGNPEIRIGPHSSIAGGASSNVSVLSFGSHTGTHIDAPRHIFDDGETVDGIPLERLIGRALLIEMSDDVRAIGEAHLAAHDLTGVLRVLLKTRNSAFVTKREFVKDFTYLAPEAAAFLLARGIELVGVDYLSVEQFRSGHHLTHRTLLEKGVVILEGLDLSEPSPGPYDLVCLPLRLPGLDGAPARVVLIRED